MPFGEAPSYGTPQYGIPAGGYSSPSSGPKAFNKIAEEPYVTAPPDSRRAQLQRQRKGGTGYGSALSRAGQQAQADPMGMLTLAAAPLVGLGGLTRQVVTKRAQQTAGNPLKNYLRKVIMPFRFGNTVDDAVINQVIPGAGGALYEQSGARKAADSGMNYMMLRQLGLIQ